MSEERCETCRFWRNYSGSDDDTGDLRTCRRLPPSPNLAHAIGVILNLRDRLRIEFTHAEEEQDPYELKDGSLSWQFGQMAVWPQSFAEDWCGEWSPRKPLPVVPKGGA